MGSTRKTVIKTVVPAFALVLILAAALCACGGKTASGDKIPVKVLILPAFEIEKMSGDFPGEAQFYYEEYLQGGEEYVVEGAYGNGKLYYKDGVALCLLGEGKVSAALTTNSILSDARFDFSDAYILTTGCAGASIGNGTMGDVFVISSCVDYDLGHHADPREMTGDSETTWFHDEEFDPFAKVDLDPELTDKVYGMVKDTKLESTETTRKILNKHYPDEAWAKRQPQVLKGTSATGDNFWKGDYDHQNALLIVETYGCKDPYVATDMENIAVAQAVEGAGMLDRLIILRDAVNMDVFLPGMTPEGQWDPKSIESLASGDSSETIDIFPTAMENNFKVGDIIVQAILKGEF